SLVGDGWSWCWYGPPRVLDSFPTRRSSDLTGVVAGQGVNQRLGLLGGGGAVQVGLALGLEQRQGREVGPPGGVQVHVFRPAGGRLRGESRKPAACGYPRQLWACSASLSSMALRLLLHSTAPVTELRRNSRSGWPAR